MGLDSWKTSAEAGGGTLNAFVSHVFHYLEWFAGPIQALSACLFRSPGDTRSGDTLVTLGLRLASGVPVTVSVSSQAFLGTGHQVAFYGNEGTLVLDNGTADYARGFRLLLGTRRSDQLEELTPVENGEAPGDDGRVPLVERLATRFVNWMREGIPARPDFSDGLRVQALLDAARRSHESGCRVQEPF
jgi:predicted dehydrogenase